MADGLKRFGFILLLAVIAIAMANEMLGLGIPFLNNSLYVEVGGLAAAMIVGGFLLGAMGLASSKVKGKRCPRCGKRVEKGQLYCRDHQKKALEELRDQDRTLEHTGYGRRHR